MRSPKRAHRHVFVEGLIGGGAPDQELLGVVGSFRPFIRVIVLHFVIVPGDDRRNPCVQILQIRIEPILRIAIAVGRQRRGHDAIAMPPHDRPILLDGLVDIVAEKKNEVGIFAG